MNKRIILSLGASALLVGATAAGIASASDRNAADAKAAAAGATKAGKALARHEAAEAVAAAEGAVMLAPNQAEYRLLLGQSYLAAGRFASARAAYGDALSLAPTSTKAALNLVLSQIATGDWGAARRTLDEHGATIAPADRGLALALAGDTAGAVALLSQVARSPDASPKVRQNLALALALGGQWGPARAVAAVDVSPADLDARMEQWAAFAHPRGASDQVATLLGVTPGRDPGQPAQLALGGTEPAVAVAAAAAPVPPSADSKPVALAAAEPSPAPQPGFAHVVFAPRAEVVQPLPAVSIAKARVLRPDAGPAKVALAAAPATPATAPTTKGRWFVQLGAFGSSAVAQNAWSRAAHRLPALAGREPSGASFTAAHTTVYRLSVGGFSRGEADGLCQRYRAVGGACFVRAGAGDQIAAWAHRGTQVAAR